MIDVVDRASSLLWSIVGILGALILLWGLWQVIQIVRNLREYGLEYIGFLRGELYKVADKHELKILKPSEKKHRIHAILFEEEQLDQTVKKHERKTG
jgi:hypothetical protein